MLVKDYRYLLDMTHTNARYIIAIASRDYFVETDNGYYSVDTINGGLQLYKARRTRKFVRQEIDWFSETFQMLENYS